MMPEGEGEVVLSVCSRRGLESLESTTSGSLRQGSNAAPIRVPVWS